MSSGLVKQMFMVLQSEEKCVIDADELIQKRQDDLERWQREAEEEEAGFVSGLPAEELEIAEEGNVIKSRESADQIMENAQAAARTTLAAAQTEAETILREARARAEAEKSRVLDEARQQGYSEGYAKAQTEAEAIRQEYKEKEAELEQFYQQQIEELEPRMVDTISAIYEHILHVDFQSYREILGHLISDTLRKMEGGHDFMVHVSKEDYPYVSMQKKEILAGAVAANCNVEVVEDQTLAKNECLIETDSGIYDCGLDTQLDALKRKLMLLAWQRE
ncbi:MAG: FliH/SctL family protein [Butyrivibrio sp.]|nr:FliH/SctL family protein [Acetatifactor muris]MCM1558118.1 FliH/SctL family protein [Butyrivibrio sp.]